MFSFSKYSVSLGSLVGFNFNFGANVTGIGQIGSSGQPAANSIEELQIPWQDLPENHSVFSYLSWHRQMSEFAGRKEEMAALEVWAGSEHAVSVKFVTGEGGVGKSRLGAEFAEGLKKKKWSAGFVNLHKPIAFPLNKEGTLLIVDYPEENRTAVCELLRDLSGIGPIGRFRVLFLTRQEITDWEEAIHDAKAENIVDRKPIQLGAAEPRRSAHGLPFKPRKGFGEARHRAPSSFGGGSGPVGFDVFRKLPGAFHHGGGGTQRLKPG